MKLSRAGWNNVIIFSVMGFILLINMTNENVFQKEEAPNTAFTVLTSSQVILTLTINQDIIIERFGANWQVKPIKLTTHQLDQMMRSWQSASGMSINEPFKPNEVPFVDVEIIAANEPLPIKLNVYTFQDQLVIYKHRDQSWLSFPAQLQSQLLPDVIFSSIKQ